MAKASSDVYGRMNAPSSYRAQDKLFGANALAAMTFPVAWESAVFRHYTFTEHALDTTNQWVVNKSASATANFAKLAGGGGRITANTSATASQIVTLSQDLDWSGAKNCGMEVRYQLDAVSSVHLEMGFVDASTSTAAISVSGINTPALTNGVVDAALIAMDTGDTLTTLALLGGNSVATTTTKAALGTVAPAAAVYQTLRIQVIGSTILGIVKDANNAEVVRASLPAGITAATAIKPWIAFKNLTTSARNPIINYVTLWQDA